MKRKGTGERWKQQEVTPRIFYFLLLFLVIMLPLVAFPNVFEDVFDLPKVTVLRTAALAITCSWLVWVVYRSKISWRVTPLNLPLAAFLASTIIATAFSFNPLISLFGTSFKRHEALPTWLSYFVICFAGSNFLREPRRLQNLLRVMLVTSLLISVYSIFQHFGYDPFRYNLSGSDRFRSFAMFGNAVFLGSYLVLTVPLASSLTLWEKDVRLRVLWLATGTLALTALTFTYTRGAWIGGLVGLFVFVYYVSSREGILRREGKRWLLILALSLILVVLVAPATEKIFPIDISVRERLVSAFELKGSVASRLSIWRSMIGAISVRPWLGWGPETQRLVVPSFREGFFVELEGASKIPDRPHNQLLNISYSFGLPGALSYVWLLVAYLGFSILRLGEVKDRDYLLSIGILSGSLGYVAQEQFSFSVVGVAPLFWLLMGANASFLAVESSSKSFSLRVSSGLRQLVVAAMVLLFVASLFLAARSVVADFYYNEGTKNGGDTERATKYFGQAVSYNPLDPQYIFAYGEGSNNIALATRNLDWVERSISSYRKALALSPYDYDLLYGLGNSYFVKAYLEGGKDYSLAKAAYAKAIKYEPYFAEAYTWLGTSYLAEGELDPALKNLRKAIQLAPQDLYALDALSDVYEKKGDIKRAIYYLEKIRAINPSYQPAVRDLERLKALSQR